MKPRDLHNLHALKIASSSGSTQLFNVEASLGSIQLFNVERSNIEKLGGAWGQGYTNDITFKKQSLNLIFVPELLIYTLMLAFNVSLKRQLET